jgi:hypothetical protein
MMKSDPASEMYYNLNIPMMMYRVPHNNFIMDCSEHISHSMAIVVRSCSVFYLFFILSGRTAVLLLNWYCLSAIYVCLYLFLHAVPFKGLPVSNLSPGHVTSAMYSYLSCGIATFLPLNLQDVQVPIPWTYCLHHSYGVMHIHCR